MDRSPDVANRPALDTLPGRVDLRVVFGKAVLHEVMCAVIGLVDVDPLAVRRTDETFPVGKGFLGFESSGPVEDADDVAENDHLRRRCAADEGKLDVRHTPLHVRGNDSLLFHQFGAFVIVHSGYPFFIVKILFATPVPNELEPLTIECRSLFKRSEILDLYFNWYMFPPLVAGRTRIEDALATAAGL